MVATLFLVTSRYGASPEAIEAHLAEHRAWLDELYGRGIVMLSGRLASRLGGFMLARGIDRATLDEVLATDPFRTSNLLIHDVLELCPTRWSAAFDTMAQEIS